MLTELNPIVGWLTQETDESYEASLEGLLHSFRSPADRYLYRYYPEGSSGYDADSLVYAALESLQRIILDQYLPVLEPGRAKGVACVWPRWEKTGITVQSKDGKVLPLEPPFPGDAERQKRRFADGCEYEFTFYRNDEPGQRRRWLLYVMREWLSRQREIEQPERETPVDDATPPVAVQPSFEDAVAHEEFMQKLRSIADPDDLRTALTDGDGEDDTVRKRRQRSLEKLYAAGRIILRSSSDAVARAYFDRLKQNPDGRERKGILDEYFTRHCKEAWRKVRASQR
jgi:hypothetical protein